MYAFIHSTAGKGSFWNSSGNVGERFLEICFFSPWIWSSEQKESLLKSAAQTRCVKWELPGCDFSGKHPLAIVSQSTSAGPSTLTPYMRDQGLPRCSGERRAQCETGQPGPQNTHFLCVLGALVGFQMGSVTQATPHLFLMESVAFSRGLWAPSDSIQLHNKFFRKESLFRLRLFIQSHLMQKR